MGKIKGLDNLFTIHSLTGQENNNKCDVLLNTSHPVYAGHFPGQPVLPGVCMLYIIKSCVSRLLQKPVQFTSIRSCKFISVVDPRVTEQLSCHFKLSEEDKLEAILTQEETTVIKLKAIFKIV